MSELSHRSGVPVGTVKYYLREGLLPAGRATSATQAQYDDEHLQRLTLIRVLVRIGGLSIAATRQVLQAIDHPPASMHSLLGTAHTALATRTEPLDEISPEARERTDQLLQRLGWQSVQGAAYAQLAVAIDGLALAGLPATDAELDRYAVAAEQIARGDVAGVPFDSPDLAIRWVVTKTVLAEPMLLALRRLAQEHVSATWLTGGNGDEAASPTP